MPIALPCPTAVIGGDEFPQTNNAASPTHPQAIGAYTAGAAWLNFVDDSGVLAAGRAADLVILSADPHAKDAANLYQVVVETTMVDGVAVYDAKPQ